MIFDRKVRRSATTTWISFPDATSNGRVLAVVCPDRSVATTKTYFVAPLAWCLIKCT